MSGWDALGELPGWRAEVERETSIDVYNQAIRGGRVVVIATHRPTGIKATVEDAGVTTQLMLKAQALKQVQDAVWAARSKP